MKKKIAQTMEGAIKLLEAILAPEHFMWNVAQVKKMLSSSICKVPPISALNLNGILKRFFAFSLA